MAKYTREQIEGKLTKVFDSTLQTKKVKLKESAEITPDEGYLGLKSVNVTVVGGGNSGGNDDPETDKKLERNDVNFFDYDGTLLYAYTWEEALELTELPKGPEHEGLVFQEWNYSLEDIREQGNGCFFEYISDNGYISNDYYYYEMFDDYQVFITPWYSNVGDWVIVKETNGDKYYWAEITNNGYEIDFSDVSPDYIEYVSIKGKCDVGACYENNNAMVIPDNVLIIRKGNENEIKYESYVDRVFSVVSIPNTIKSISTDGFYNCIFINEFKIPIKTSNMNSTYFSFLYCNFSNVHLNGKSIIQSWFGLGNFGENYKIQDGTVMLYNTFDRMCFDYLKVPNSVKYLYGEVFGASYGYCDSIIGTRVVDFSEFDHVPYVEDVTAFSTWKDYNPKYIIIVPDSLYDTWINETNWTVFADAGYIQPSSKYKNIKN